MCKNSCWGKQSWKLLPTCRRSWYSTPWALEEYNIIWYCTFQCVQELIFFSSRCRLHGLKLRKMNPGVLVNHRTRGHPEDAAIKANTIPDTAGVLFPARSGRERKGSSIMKDPLRHHLEQPLQNKGKAEQKQKSCLDARRTISTSYTMKWIVWLIK